MCLERVQHGAKGEMVRNIKKGEEIKKNISGEQILEILKFKGWELADIQVTEWRDSGDCKELAGRQHGRCQMRAHKEWNESEPREGDVRKKTQHKGEGGKGDTIQDLQLCILDRNNWKSPDSGLWQRKAPARGGAHREKLLQGARAEQKAVGWKPGVPGGQGRCRVLRPLLSLSPGSAMQSNAAGGREEQI